MKENSRKNKIKLNHFLTRRLIWIIITFMTLLSVIGMKRETFHIFTLYLLFEIFIMIPPNLFLSFNISKNMNLVYSNFLTSIFVIIIYFLLKLPDLQWLIRYYPLLTIAMYFITFARVMVLKENGSQKYL